MAETQVNVNFDMLGVSRVVNLPDASTAQEPVTLAQALALVDANSWKASVRAASTGNVNIASPGTALDGVTLATGNRVLLKNQTNPAENGLYDVLGLLAPLNRTRDSNTFRKLEGAVVIVEEGTVNGNTRWKQTAVNGILGTDAVVFSADTSSVPAASETVSGAVELATHSEVNAGTDNARAVTPLGLAQAFTVVRWYRALIGDGVSTTIDVHHNLFGGAFLERAASVVVSEQAAPYRVVQCEVQNQTDNMVRLVFNTAPSPDEYVVLVMA